MSDQRLTSKLGQPTEPKYNTSAAATKNTSPNNFFIFCLHFLFWVLELSDTDPSRPYMNHYSRGIFQEQALLPIWSISLSKWLNSGDKRKEAQMGFLILPIVTVFLNEYHLVFLFLRF